MASTGEITLVVPHQATFRQVPEYWKTTESLIPQFVGLGRYHHSRPDGLPVTNKLKLAAANCVLYEIFHLNEGGQFVQKCLKQLAMDSDFEDKTLLYAQTVDGLFLLAFLHRHINLEEYFSSLTGTYGTPLVNAAGSELTVDAIKRDVLMLENQLPIHFLKQIREVFRSKESQLNSKENFGSDLDWSMLGFNMRVLSGELCPLVYPEVPSKKLEDHDHLLGFMYSMIVPGKKKTKESYIQSKKGMIRRERVNLKENYRSRYVDGSAPLYLYLFDYLLNIWNSLRLNRNREGNWFSYIIRFMLCCIFGPPVFLMFVATLIFLLILKPCLWALLYFFRTLRRELLPLLGSLPSLSITIDPVLKVLHNLEAQFPQLLFYTSTVVRWEKINSVFQQDSGFVDSYGQISAFTAQRHDQVELGFPLDSTARLSATELVNAGIQLRHTRGAILSCKFDEVECQFFLPSIKLDVNSQVIINNLVAYEALTKSEELIFTRYIKLMRALINTAEDVRLLVRLKIIHTHLSDEVVVKLLKEMNILNRPTRTPELDLVFSKVYFKFLSARNQKQVATKYVVSSGKFFIVIAILAYLALTAVQTYCSVFGCSSASKFGQLPEDGFSINYI